MVRTFLEYSSQYLLFTLVYTAKLISSCHCWSKWEYVRIMQTCMYMQGNGEESTLNICLLPKNSIFFRLLVCVFFLLWSQQEENSVIKSTLTVAQSATILQRAARLKAMTVPLSVSCSSSGYWQVTQLFTVKVPSMACSTMWPSMEPWQTETQHQHASLTLSMILMCIVDPTITIPHCAQN